MGDVVLVFSRHLGKGHVMAFWLEDWVVAKALVSGLLCPDSTLHDAFKEVLFAVFYQCKDGTELRRVLVRDLSSAEREDPDIFREKLRMPGPEPESEDEFSD